MNIQTLNIAPNMASDSTFRAWGLAISNAIAAAGLIKTADTGQIDWTTVIKPAAPSTMAGYEVWRFTDSLQATHPVFVKIFYGTSGNINNPGLQFRVGGATDGAGNLIVNPTFPNSLSAITTAISTYTTVWGGPTAAPFFVASDGGSSLMLSGWWYYGTILQSGCFILVERCRNFDGSPSNEGVYYMVATGYTSNSTANVPSYGVLLFANASAYSIPGMSSALLGGVMGEAGGGNPTVSSGVVGGNVHGYPIFTGRTPRLNGPSKHVLTMHNNDIGANAQQTFTHYGEVCTFRCIGFSTYPWSSSTTGVGCFRVA